MANENFDLNGISFDEPEEGTRVQSKSARYSPKKCFTVDGQGNEKRFPVQGVLVGAEYHPNEKDPKRSFHDLVIRLTKPSYGVQGEDQELVRLEPGNIMLVTATHRLKPWIEVAKRDNPDTMPEIWLQPIEEIGVGKDQTLWEYTVRVIKHHDAKAIGAMQALMTEKAAALPAAGGSLAVS